MNSSWTWLEGGLAPPSDAELLAAATGIPAHEAEDALRSLCGGDGIGDAHGALSRLRAPDREPTRLRLRAALELGLRLTSQRPARRRIQCAGDLWRLLRGHAADPREQIWVAALDAALAVQAVERVAEGTVCWVRTTTAELLRTALRAGASAFIVAHNHPSGTLEPSREDVAFTRRTLEAAATVDLVMLDHVVIGPGGFTSLREREPGLPWTTPEPAR